MSITLRTLVKSITLAMSLLLCVQVSYAFKVWNMTDEPVTLCNPAANKCATKLTIQPGQGQDVTWGNYVSVKGSTSGATYCKNLQYSTRFNPPSPNWGVSSQPAAECTPIAAPDPGLLPPLLAVSASASVQQGEVYSDTVTATNQNSSTVPPSVQFDSKPAWLNVSQQAQGNQLVVNVSGTPSVVGDVSYTVVASVGGLTTSRTVTISVQARPEPPVHSGLIPRTVSAWIYDASNGMRMNNTTPGQFIDGINAWNAAVGPLAKITELHTYGTDMEMWQSKYEAYYVPNTFDTNKYETNPGFTGFSRVYGPENVRVYQQGVHDAQYFSPIVDGRTDQGGYLPNFNNLSVTDAGHYADMMAQQFCLDSMVDSMQVDVEPLDFAIRQSGSAGDDMSLNAQVAFYKQLAFDLSGDNPRMLVCGGKPRWVSVFTFAYKLRAGLTPATHHSAETAAALVELLKSDNFLVIGSLYDLPASAPVSSKSVSQYQAEVKQELIEFLTLQKIYDFNFKFGIPVSCSYHECHTTMNVSQQSVAAAALNAMIEVQQMDEFSQSICANPKFKGIVLWTFANDNRNAEFPIRAPQAAEAQHLSPLIEQIMSNCSANSS